MYSSPSLLVFAGPNGSGKSTIQAGIPVVGQYVNADEIDTDNAARWRRPRSRSGPGRSCCAEGKISPWRPSCPHGAIWI